MSCSSWWAQLERHKKNYNRVHTLQLDKYLLATYHILRNITDYFVYDSKLLGTWDTQWNGTKPVPALTELRAY